MTVRVLVALAACGAADRPEPPRPASVTLDWQMRREGEQLRIDYTITNGTAGRITVVDALGGSAASDAIIVRAATESDAIAFTRAFVPPQPGFKPYHQPSPHYRNVPPAGELRGIAHVGVPLVPWHNFTGSWAITGTRTRAVLEIGYYDQPSVDATNATHAPRVGPDAFKLLRSAPKQLPAGVTLASPEEQVALGNGGIVLPP